MPLYNCDCCVFSTLLKSNYTNHLTTKKHIEKSKSKVGSRFIQYEPTFTCLKALIQLCLPS